MSPVRIAIADDHPLVRRGLRTFLEMETSCAVIAEAGDGQQAIEVVRQHRPDVVILDIGMPKLNGIETARRISSEFRTVGVVMLTVHSDESYLLSALKAGARGYVLKEAAETEIVEAVRAVSQGKAFFSPKISRILAAEYTRHRQQEQVEDSYDLLTSQERQILQLLAEGRVNKDIAAILELSPTTVISHRQHIFQKLEIHTLAELILYALRNGVIAPQRDRMGESPAAW